MNHMTDWSGSPRRRLDLSPPSSPFDQLSPVSRFDETDLNDLAPFLHHSNAPRLVSENSTSCVKSQRRCSEVFVASSTTVADGIPSFSTSHWLAALFEWIYVSFSDKKHQEYVLKEIVHCLNELGVIPFNLSISSEQLLQIQQVIDSLRRRIWHEHSREANAQSISKHLASELRNGQSLAHPFATNSRGAPQMKHSLTFAGSLAKFTLAPRPTSLRPLPRLPLDALFPAGRYKNDFVEQDQLGRGGFGVVVKAINCFDGTAYAIKKIFVKQVVSHDCLLRALREVRAASSLNHPNIVRYYSAWIETVADGLEQSADSSENSDAESSNDHFTGSFRPIPSTSSLSDEFDISHQLKKEFENIKLPEPKPYKMSVPTKKDDADDGDIYFRDDTDSKSNRSDSVVFQVDSDDDDDRGADSNKGQVVLFTRRARSPGTDQNKSDASKNKVCLFIQMELCTLGTLADTLSRRNSRAASLSSSPLPSPLPSSPTNALRSYSLGSGFEASSSLSSQSSVESLVNASWNASIFLQVVRGLAYVHSRGVIHRDLKPANIFLTGCSMSCPEVKIGDFGLTRFDVFSEHGDHTSLAQGDLMRYSAQRRYSTAVGTGTYASPEQTSRLVYTRQSDMFSLGLILYELYRPFGTSMERLSNFELLRKGGPDDLDVCERYPDIWRLIKRLTSSNPSKRPNCTDLLAELETNEVDRLREVVEQQRREIERLRQAIVVDSPSLSRFSPSS